MIFLLNYCNLQLVLLHFPYPFITIIIINIIASFALFFVSLSLHSHFITKYFKWMIIVLPFHYMHQSICYLNEMFLFCQTVRTLSALHSWFVLMRSCFFNITFTLFLSTMGIYVLGPYCLLFVRHIHSMEIFRHAHIVDRIPFKMSRSFHFIETSKNIRPSAVNCEW